MGILCSELRIGNYLHRKVYNPIPNKEDYYFDKVKVVGILKDCVYFNINNKKQIFKSNNLKPIPLTEEILLKCGFDKQGFYFLNRNSALMQMENSLSRKCFISSLLAIEIKHLHQLQNLYWCLVGEELNIEL